MVAEDPALHVITVAWNEGTFLPHFLRYYSSLGAHITVFDNESDDQTAVIASQYPRTTVRTFSTGGQLRDDINSHLKSTAWRDGPKADWIICVDVDEIIYHPDLLSFLRRCDDEAVDVVVPAGYDMAPPTASASTNDRLITERAPFGVYNALYSKPVVFSGRRVEDVFFGPGAHAARFDPAPTVIGDTEGQLLPRSPFPGTLALHRASAATSCPVKLLHYRFFDHETLTERWKTASQRRSELNRRLGYGAHYEIPLELQQQYLAWVSDEAVDLVHASSQT